jgi:adenylate kinase family enzyme
MERVLVLGSPGAGKSTFARRLAERSGLPLIHLDKHFWRPGWVEPAPEEWQRTVEKLAQQPRWIMDGDYSRTLGTRLRRADTTFLLDTPRSINVTRVLRRVATGYGRTRPDLADGCPERLDWEFLQYVWNYPRKLRPRIAAMLEEYGGEVITFRSSADIEVFLDTQVPAFKT